jgi:parvulin-like peptidyl-prolyl isomerase
MRVQSTPVALLLVAWIAAAAGCAGKSAGVVATVNGEPITREEFERFVAVKLGDLAAEPLSDTVRSQLFDDFLKREVTAQAAREHGLELGAGEAEVGALATGEEPILAEVTTDLLVEKYYREVVLRDAEVTPDEVAGYYEKHRDEFARPDGYYVREIRVGTRAEAERLRGEAASGKADFAALARSASAGPGGRPGGLAFYEAGKLPPMLERAVAPLGVGQISPVVESTYGFHVFRLEGRAAPVTLERVRDKIEDELRRRKNERLVQADAERLLERADVAIKVEDLRFQYEGRFAR